MSALGDLLELLHDASGRTRPVQLTVVEWRHLERSDRALRRFMASQAHRGYGVSVSAAATHDDGPEATSWTTRLALESPTRFREEAAGRQEGQRLLVRDGQRWWTWDASWGTVSSDSEPEGGPPASSYAFLLDPVELVVALLLEPSGAGEMAGRRAFLAHAKPREDVEHVGAALHRLGAGADRFELAVDAERGALLRTEALLGGEPFHRLEVTEITFGGPIPPETFAFAPPAGAGRWPRPVPLPLHELAAQAQFTVLVPGRVPDGWRLTTALFLEGRERPPIEPAAFLTYTSPEAAYGATLHERSAEANAADSSERLTWEHRGGLEVADEGEYVEWRYHVRVARQGTRVEITGGGDLELLIGLAESLVPAATDPPRLPER